MNIKELLLGDLYLLPSGIRNEIYACLNKRDKAKLATVSTIFARKITCDFFKVSRETRPLWKFAAKRLGIEGADKMTEEAAKKHVFQYYVETNSSLESTMKNILHHGFSVVGSFMHKMDIRGALHETSLDQAAKCSQHVGRYCSLLSFILQQRPLFHSYSFQFATEDAHFPLLALLKEADIKLNWRLFSADEYLFAKEEFRSTTQVTMARELLEKEHKATGGDADEDIAKLTLEQQNGINAKLEAIQELMDATIELQKPCYDIKFESVIDYKRFEQDLHKKFPQEFEEYEKLDKLFFDVSISDEERAKLQRHLGHIFQVAQREGIAFNPAWIFALFQMRSLNNQDLALEHLFSVLEPNLSLMLLPFDLFKNIKQEIEVREKSLEEIVKANESTSIEGEVEEEVPLTVAMDQQELKREIEHLEALLVDVERYQLPFVRECVKAWRNHSGFVKAVAAADADVRKLVGEAIHHLDTTTEQPDIINHPLPEAQDLDI